MKRQILLVLLAFFLLLSSAHSDDLKRIDDNFMTSREVLGVVRFAEGSVLLTSKAKGVVDSLIPRLEKYDPSQKIIRIEGFASKSGDEKTNITLSMARAKSVVQYLRDNYQLEIEIYLSGFGSKDSPLILNDQTCSAEVVLYDNLWKDFDLRSE